MIGAPTYETSLFPPVEEVLRMATVKRIRNLRAAMFGSYGWSKGALAEIKRITEPAGWQLIQDLEFAGGPTAETLKQGREFGRTFARAVKAG